MHYVLHYPHHNDFGASCLLIAFFINYTKEKHLACFTHLPTIKCLVFSHCSFHKTQLSPLRHQKHYLTESIKQTEVPITCNSDKKIYNFILCSISHQDLSLRNCNLTMTSVITLKLSPFCRLILPHIPILSTSCYLLTKNLSASHCHFLFTTCMCVG